MKKLKLLIVLLACRLNPGLAAGSATIDMRNDPWNAAPIYNSLQIDETNKLSRDFILHKKSGHLVECTKSVLRANVVTTATCQFKLQKDGSFQVMQTQNPRANTTASDDYIHVRWCLNENRELMRVDSKGCTSAKGAWNFLSVNPQQTRDEATQMKIGKEIVCWQYKFLGPNVSRYEYACEAYLTEDGKKFKRLGH